MFLHHDITSSHPLFPFPSSSAVPLLPPPLPPPPLPPPPSSSSFDCIISSSELADGLYALYAAPPPTSRSAAVAQVARLTALSLGFLALVDPLRAPSSQQAHVHSALLYHDPHQCEEQSIIELLPLLVQLTDALSAAVVGLSDRPLPSAAADTLPPAEPPPLPCPEVSSSAALLWTFLGVRWPVCCLYTISRVSLSLPFSAAQLRALQARLLGCVEEQRTAVTQSPVKAPRRQLGAAQTASTYDWLPLVQSLFHLAVRFSFLDQRSDDRSTAARVTGADGSHSAASQEGEVTSVSTPSPSVSWLFVLHCTLLAHRPDLLSNAHYVLDTRMHHSPPFCSYLHRQYALLLSAPPAEVRHFHLDQHHLSLLLLLSGDEDYSGRALQLLTRAVRLSAGQCDGDSGHPEAVDCGDGPIRFFTPRVDASHRASGTVGVTAAAALYEPEGVADPPLCAAPAR